MPNGLTQSHEIWYDKTHVTRTCFYRVRTPNLWAQPTPKLFDLQRRNLVRKHTRESRVFQGSQTLYRKGSRLQRLQMFLDPYLRPNGLTYSEEVW